MHDRNLIQPIPHPSSLLKRRRTVKIIESVTTREGAGFLVHRPFPGIDLHLADPFLLLDQMGPVLYEPLEARGAPDHPHRGFETITYVLEGAMEHRDSTGGGGLICAGDTQWMTAGAGIVHSEMPTDEIFNNGGAMHGVQIWVNLPKEKKWLPPRYQDITKERLSEAVNHDGTALIRIIAGTFGELEGAGQTETPIALLHTTVQPDSELELHWPAHFNALVFSLDGTAFVGSDRVELTTSNLAVLHDGEVITMRTPPGEKATELLILGGEPIGEPIARYGPFVMNTRDEIIQAIEDFESGRMGSIPPIVA